MTETPRPANEHALPSYGGRRGAGPFAFGSHKLPAVSLDCNHGETRGGD